MAKPKSEAFASRIVTGKVYWASITEPNTTFEPAYQVDLCLDENTKKLVESDGLTVKNKGDERGDYVTLKRKVMKRDGEKRQPPRVTDSHCNPWDGKLIGNGSICNIKYTPYEWNAAGRSGVSAFLDAVQIINLVEYRGSNDFEKVDGGYVVGGHIMDTDKIVL